MRPSSRSRSAVPSSRRPVMAASPFLDDSVLGDSLLMPDVGYVPPVFSLSAADDSVRLEASEVEPPQSSPAATSSGPRLLLRRVCDIRNASTNTCVDMRYSCAHNASRVCVFRGDGCSHGVARTRAYPSADVVGVTCRCCLHPCQTGRFQRWWRCGGVRFPTSACSCR